MFPTKLVFWPPKYKHYRISKWNQKEIYLFSWRTNKLKKMSFINDQFGKVDIFEEELA
jgi:hypothetical protein